MAEWHSSGIILTTFLPEKHYVNNYKPGSKANASDVAILS